MTLRLFQRGPRGPALPDLSLRNLMPRNLAPRSFAPRSFAPRDLTPPDLPPPGFTPPGLTARCGRIVLIVFEMLVAVGLLLWFLGPANATSGYGCWRPVGVAFDDVLNVRARPSARSAIVATIPPGGGPIIAGGRSRGGAEAACGPQSRARPSRWCSVQVYDGDRVNAGYIKRRFLAHSECP